MITWKLEAIDSHLSDIKNLFAKNANHRHALNYTKWPLFEFTKFARMGWDTDLIYYSSGIERPEYNGSIRIMSRHTRDTSYNFGGLSADLKRGLQTLDLSTEYALSLGYTDIWVSREETPELLHFFAKNSKYQWTVSRENLPGAWVGGNLQYILRMQ